MTASENNSVVGPQRLLSLDALRGFDMFWIVAAGDLLNGLTKASTARPVQCVAHQLRHAPWEGFRFYDLIFPLFVFIVGVSLVFSITRSVERHGRSATVRRIVRRSLLMFMLGIIYYGGFTKGTDNIRLLGVLQRIAIVYMFAAFIFMLFRPRGIALICVGLLLLYWALMTFVPVPGVGAGCFEPGRNLANYLDIHYLPLHKYSSGGYDPEGLLSTIPAVASCLLGVLAGMLLDRHGAAPARKVLLLFAAGIVGLILGYAWGRHFPVVKPLWTSSFVLVAGGYSSILLGLFYLVIDVWKISSWCMPFVWIGTNAITLYMIRNLVDFGRIADRLVGGPIKGWFGAWDQFIVGLVVVLMAFALARFLYKHKVFLRL